MWQFDLCLSVCSLAYLIALLLTDLLPPHIFDSNDGLIKKAFDKASEQGFVEMFTEFASYAVTLQEVVNLGAILIFIFFLRCIAIGSLHPRVALFVNTVLEIVNDMSHFMLTFGVLFVALALIGHLFMGSYRSDFADLPIALETQFMIITGSFPFPNFGTKSPAIELLYLLSFAFIVFFFLTYACMQHAAMHTSCDECFTPCMLSVMHASCDTCFRRRMLCETYVSCWACAYTSS